MHREVVFGSWSLAAAGVTILLAQVFHPVVLGALWVGGTAAWLAALLGGLFAFLLFWPVAAAVSGSPEGTLVSLARVAAGRTGAVITALLVGGLLVFHSALTLRAAAEMAVTMVFPHTPQTFATVALVAGALYGALGGTDAIVFLSRAFLPLLVLIILLIVFGSIGWGEARYLLPVWGPGPLPLAIGSTALTGLFVPLLFLLVGSRHLRDRGRLWRAGLVSVAVTAVLIALTKVILVMSFPFPMGESVAFPLHAMARLVIGGRFFERIESLWLFFWVYATSCHLAALFHAASAMYAEAVGFPTHRIAVLPLVLAATTLAFLPRDIAETITWHIQAVPVAAVIGFGLPLLLALVAAGRRRLGRDA